jgi:hypothetical protein
MKYSITDLRRAGFKVYVTHLRHFDLFHINSDHGFVTSEDLVQIRYTNKNNIPREFRNTILPNGGATQVHIEGHGFYAEGVSVCSDNDSFVKRKGYHAAFGRAVSNLLSILDSEGVSIISLNYENIR